MFERLQSRIGLRNLNFGGEGGGRTKEILVGGGLAVIVIVALVLVIHSVFQPPKPKEETHHMKCIECGHEFQVENTELPDDAYDMETFEIRMDCPECGAKGSCVTMMQCPKCQKWFVKPEEGTLKCPHCGIDVSRYVRQQYKKKQK